MKWQDWIKFVGDMLPVVGSFVKWIVDLPDKDWEQISKAWPAPTKTEMAWLRSEAKARMHFFGED